MKKKLKNKILYIALIFIIFPLIVGIILKYLPSSKQFQVNISLTNFKKHSDDLCVATFNVMNIGDYPFTIQDFYLAIGMTADGTKSVYRAINENKIKIKPVK